MCPTVRVGSDLYFLMNLSSIKDSMTSKTVMKSPLLRPLKRKKNRKRKSKKKHNNNLKQPMLSLIKLKLRTKCKRNQRLLFKLNRRQTP